MICVMKPRIENDDSTDIFEQISTLLSDAETVVTRVPNPDQAITMITEGSTIYDLVIIDREIFKAWKKGFIAVLGLELQEYRRVQPPVALIGQFNGDTSAIGRLTAMGYIAVLNADNDPAKLAEQIKRVAPC